MGLFSFSSVTVMGLNSKSQIASISVCLPSLVKSVLFHMALELCEVIQFLVLNVFLPLALQFSRQLISILWVQSTGQTFVVDMKIYKLEERVEAPLDSGIKPWASLNLPKLQNNNKNHC